MSLVPIRLRRLGGSLRGLLVRNLRLTQVGRQWQVVLEATPAPAAPTHDEAVAKHLAAMSPQRRHRMRRQLSALLRRHPKAREIFRHLALVEQSLRSTTASRFARLPPKVLRAAQEQLLALVTDWSELGLQDLRATLQLALKEHGISMMSTPQPDALSIDLGRGVQVQDASVSMFMEAEGNWFAAAAQVAGRPTAG
jgi:hypothetical protein